MAGDEKAGDAVLRSAMADLQPLALHLLDTPLDFILADHLRQRSLCACFRAVAGVRRLSAVDAESFAAFLTREIPLHHQDEDDDLFPATRRRAVPEDNLDPVLERLKADHEGSSALAESIAAALLRHARRDEVTISPRLAQSMVSFAAHEHRHLAIENGIVLVIARKRLVAGDLKAMSQSMKARRGVPA